MVLMIKKFIFVALCLFLSVQLYSQTRTVGLFINDTANTYKGYTLMPPNKYTATYLINNDGRLIHKWSHSIYSPGNAAYLLPTGHLLRTCKVSGYLTSAEGGRIEEYSWGDTLLWSFDYNTANYITHHDIKYLPNGNIIAIACEKKTLSQLVAAGFDSSRFNANVKTAGYALPDYVIEIHPTYPSGGTIVWEWHVWDHLIQDHDSTKLNWGVVANHPELISSAGAGLGIDLMWNHCNSIFYDSRFDQIVISTRDNSEMWIIDHSTTTAQSAGHTGGRYGQGGDLLYRWGNPLATYKTGDTSYHKLYMQHDAEWIDTLCPGYGGMTIFNNGVGRNYTSIDQYIPPRDSLGFYHRTTGTPFGPQTLAWSYTATPVTSFYCANIGGAQRLPNGNTLVCNGVAGTLFEVTSSGTVVWKYINPVTNTGPLYWNGAIPLDSTHPGTTQNLVFKVHRYSSTYPGLAGRDLTPGNFIELYQSGVIELGNNMPNTFELCRNYPNPFNPATKIKFSIPKDSKGGMRDVKLVIFDMLGREIQTLVNEKLQPGTYETTFDALNYSSGIYFYKMITDGFSETKKMILLK